MTELDFTPAIGHLVSTTKSHRAFKDLTSTCPVLMAPGRRGNRGSSGRGKRQGRAKASSNPRKSASARYITPSRNGTGASNRSNLASRSSLGIQRQGSIQTTFSASSPTNYVSAARSANSRPAHSFTPVNAPRTDSVLEDRSSDDSEEVVLAVDMRDRGTVGCCYYVAAEETLYFMEDMPLGNAEVIDQREAACPGHDAPANRSKSSWSRCPPSS